MLDKKGFPEKKLIKIRTETTTTEPTHVISAFISYDNSQIKPLYCCKPSVIHIATAHTSKNKKHQSVLLQGTSLITENISLHLTKFSDLTAGTQQHPIGKPLWVYGKINQIQYLVLSTSTLPFSCWTKKDTKHSLLPFSSTTIRNSRDKFMIMAYTSKTKTKPNKKVFSHALLWSLQTSVFFLNTIHIPLCKHIKWEFSVKHIKHFKMHGKRKGIYSKVSWDFL